ncbi:hypothetical protein Sme01_04010 [Sphaerisporangium melleum]|uniref:Uncharacterized protein n=1 Tax=Sphaerisporangium melleum TaxID=321316 RepID=A0A917QP87_9ACTN|nr:hypothetical protein [Sphaerisporangium melleum]GGK62082.1 hypothetical protein GCM10007964_01560 [Sphaerisporangium melleum]GII67925.1 hypothetical protein Sme01_04010 [Sphaerisporangium melleum]
MRDRGNSKGNQPYPNQAPVQSAPAPAPVPVFPSEHARKSFETRQNQHYRAVIADASRQAGTAVGLGRQIDSLSQANQQDADSIAAAEQSIREMRVAIDQRNQEIARLADEKGLNERMAQNNRDDAEATARLLEMHGCPRPTVDVLVAPVAEQTPTGDPGALPCRCGDLMRLDLERNQYIHDIPGGGWELAGESCKRRRQDTLTMPPVDDVAVG